LQKVVALSSTEAEYIALTETMKEVVFVRALLRELQEMQKTPTSMVQKAPSEDDSSVILGDNQGSLALAYNPEFHGRTKHIDTRYHAIRQKVASGVIELDYCNTADMIADVFTKPTPPPTFAKHVSMLVSPCPMPDVGPK
jgi:hypothetical protein